MNFDSKVGTFELKDFWDHSRDRNLYYAAKRRLKVRKSCQSTGKLNDSWDL
jgi:hypothetical protein